MKIISITDPVALNSFLSARDEPVQFGQSWEWGQFRRSQGHLVRRLGERASDGQLRWAASLEERALPSQWRYWYVERGPVFSASLPAAEQGSVARDIARFVSNDGHVLFLRIEPAQLAWGDEGASIPPAPLKRTHHLSPAETLYLDLRLDESALRSAMHQKTRYNIGLAEKRAVLVQRSADPADLDRFIELMSKTSQRDRFRSHSAAHYRALLSFFGSGSGRTSPQVELFIARHANRTVAANIVVFFGNTATYLHGASSYEDRALMAPHLLQWWTIQEAKRRGYRWYDFWGIARQPGHPWAGVTRFKLGFGGQPVAYPGTFDLPLRNGWYRMYEVARRVRRNIG